MVQLELSGHVLRSFYELGVLHDIGVSFQAANNERVRRRINHGLASSGYHFDVEGVHFFIVFDLWAYQESTLDCWRSFWLLQLTCDRVVEVCAIQAQINGINLAVRVG